MMNVRTAAYFDDLVARAERAHVVRREPWAYTLPNRCRDNCEAFARQRTCYVIVRGWLVQGEHFFMPRSILGLAGNSKTPPATLRRSRCSGRMAMNRD